MPSDNSNSIRTGTGPGGEYIPAGSSCKGGLDNRHVPIHRDFLSDLRMWHEADRKKGHIVHHNDRPIKTSLMRAETAT